MAVKVNSKNVTDEYSLTSHTHNYAGSSSAGGAADKANAVEVTSENPTSNQTRYLAFTNGSGGQSVKTNNGLCYITKEGTASAEGLSLIALGNSVASGTAGNKRGRLRIFSNTKFYTDLYAATDQGNNRTIYLPNAAGTLALTSDLNSLITAVSIEDDGVHITKKDGTTDVDPTVVVTKNSSGNIHLNQGKKLLLNTGAIYSNANQDLTIQASGERTYGMSVTVADSAWTVCPLVNKNMNLGSASYLWNTIYAFSGTIQTSDRREKHDIKDIESEKIVEFLNDLSPVFYRFNDKPEKLYAGLIAQDVEEVMQKHSISEDFGLLDKSPKLDEDGNETGDYSYGLNYGQLIAPMLSVIQKQESRITELEKSNSEKDEKINSLEERLKALESLVSNLVK